MTKQSELLAFLTNKDNLPFVIDILRQADPIRCFLLNQFMTDLKCYLEEHAALKKPDSPKWELTVRKETNDICGGLELWNARVPREYQYLQYSVEHTADVECEVTVCLGWKDDEISKNSKLHKLEAVGQIGGYLKSQGLKKGDTACRYKYIREDNSLDEFLADIIDDEKKQSLFRQISDCFWPLVDKTFGMVEAANEEIARVVKK
jgi:hypothetical protein